jgi:methylmalonyl-CoA/ethylmalonyl-CoA epimerase
MALSRALVGDLAVRISCTDVRYLLTNTVPPETVEPRFEITQIGLVVPDLMASVRAYHDTFGWGPWRIFDIVPPDHRCVTVRGREVESGFRIAIAQVGQIDFELIEPLDGPSQHREFLEATGGGLNHVLVRGYGPDGQELEVDVGALGLDELMSGSFGRTEYTYREGGELRTIFEFVRGNANAAGGGLEPDAVYP